MPGKPFGGASDGACVGPRADGAVAGGRRLFLSGAGCALAGGLLPLARAQPESRMALVIGNARYESSPLANPINDMRLMAGALGELGFQVTTLADAARGAMVEGLRLWLGSATQAKARLVYFAGHGARYRGRNFLIPVDAKLQSEDDLPAMGVNVDELGDRLSRYDSGVNILVLDACRSIATLHPSPGSRARSATPQRWVPGFTSAAAPRGTVVAYSTSPGAVASDNPQQKNSVYTRHLVAQLGVPGQPLETVFKKTREAVWRESQGAQLPWESSSLVGDFCFSPNRAGVCGAPQG